VPAPEFLALAAMAGVDVVGYDDEAFGVLQHDQMPLRLKRIQLAPTITVAAGTDVRIEATVLVT
jgi:hypothetical protein